MESDIESNDLLGFVSSLRGGDGLRVEETLGDGYVRLRVSEAERRQAKHDVRCMEDAVIELLRNSRDAQATRIFVGTAREGDLRTIVVADDGVGIPPEMHARVFDARVTSKLDTMRMDRWGVHGRGMALFSIRENARSAEVMRSGVGCGCALRVVFDVSQLPERADQSTWPTVTGDVGNYTIRGPHNIYHTCVEFALEERGTCNVYVGSPSEVLSTMRVRALEQSRGAFCRSRMRPSRRGPGCPPTRRHRQGAWHRSFRAQCPSCTQGPNRPTRQRCRTSAGRQTATKARCLGPFRSQALDNTA